MVEEYDSERGRVEKSTIVGQGGGPTETGHSPLEWDASYFRLFVGNLAGEATDDFLLKAFSRYPSAQKACVVRDKCTGESKGYGFVGFSDGDERLRAAREMHGKYIGSHPVLPRAVTTNIRPLAAGGEQGAVTGSTPPTDNSHSSRGIATDSGPAGYSSTGEPPKATDCNPNLPFSGSIESVSSLGEAGALKEHGAGSADGHVSLGKREAMSSEGIVAKLILTPAITRLTG